jgi:hypothetical protein
MKKKLEKLIKQWHIEQNDATKLAKKLAAKHQYCEAQKAQTKAVYIEKCMNDLINIL